jgi:hypothetical protein
LGETIKLSPASFQNNKHAHHAAQASGNRAIEESTGQCRCILVASAQAPSSIAAQGQVHLEEGQEARLLAVIEHEKRYKARS